MANLISIARPYARAAFACALEEKNLDAWSTLLAQAAKIIKGKAMQVLLRNPRIDKMEAYECLLALCKSLMFPFGKNFLKLMALKQRLLVLPEIEYLFQQYKAERAKQVTAHAISAVPLTKVEQQTLVNALSQRLQRQVILEQHIDNYLLGGLVIRVGDLVIDSSVRGKLERLRATLVN